MFTTLHSKVLTETSNNTGFLFSPTADDRASSECSSAAEALDEIHEHLQSGGAGVSCLHLLLAVAIAAVGILVSSLLLIGPRPPGSE